MQLEVGKRYVRRDGKTTTSLIRGCSLLYPFKDSKYDVTYTESGYMVPILGCMPEDLISEYIEAKPSTIEAIEKELAAERNRAFDKLAELEKKLEEARKPKRREIKHGDYGVNSVGERKLFIHSVSSKLVGICDEQSGFIGMDANTPGLEFTILGNIFEDMKNRGSIGIGSMNDSRTYTHPMYIKP